MSKNRRGDFFDPHCIGTKMNDLDICLEIV